jgi:hypothetical protein
LAKFEKFKVLKCLPKKWLEVFSTFSFTTSYIKGKENENAHFLLREVQNKENEKGMKKMFLHAQIAK